MTRIQSVRRLASIRATCASAPAAPRLALAAATQTRSLSQTASRSAPLRLPPRQRTEAETEEAAASVDASYTPAESIADLDTSIPVLKSWWKQPQNWSPKQDFQGFGATAKITDKVLVEVMVRRALVEVVAAEGSEVKLGRWSEGGRAALDQALQVGVQVQDGRAVLTGDAAPVVEALKSEAAVEAGEQITAEEAAEMLKAWGHEWKNVAINDETKFLVCLFLVGSLSVYIMTNQTKQLRKRLFQLTGSLLPDAKLGAVRTPADLITLLSLAPKPKKLHLHLRESSAFQGLPNVKIHGRRVTPIDKEKTVGRWKVIEEELVKRDLPVTGKGEAARHMERKWLAGRR